MGNGSLSPNDRNHHPQRLKVALKEGSPRFFTTQADATHFSGCKGTILSEDGLYEGMADDAINVHGTYLKLTNRIDDHTVRARYMHPQTYGFKWGEVGDTLQIIRSKTMDIVDTGYKITAIKAVDTPTDFGAKEFEIQVDKLLPSFEESESYGLENLTWAPQVVFRNNIVRNNRARGLFLVPREKCFVRIMSLTIHTVPLFSFVVIAMAGMKRGLVAM